LVVDPDRFSRGVLFDLKSDGSDDYFVSLLLLTLVALAACYIPARRSTKVILWLACVTSSAKTDLFSADEH